MFQNLIIVVLVVKVRSCNENYALCLKGLEMKKEMVDILSDATNQPVMRHPGRNYPGVLVQGDTLHSYCRTLDEVCRELRENNVELAFDEINELRNALWDKLNHYKYVLGEHDIELPFNETP